MADDEEEVINRHISQSVNIKAAKSRLANSDQKLRISKMAEEIRFNKSLLSYWLCARQLFCVQVASAQIEMQGDNGVRFLRTIPDYFISVKLNTKKAPIVATKIVDMIKSLFKTGDYLSRYIGRQIHFLRGLPGNTVSIAQVIRRIVFDFIADSLTLINVQVSVSTSHPNEEDGRKLAGVVDDQFVDEVVDSRDCSDLVSYYVDIRSFKRANHSEIVAKRHASSFLNPDITPVNSEAWPLIVTPPNVIKDKMAKLYKPAQSNTLSTQLAVCGVANLTPLPLDFPTFADDMSFVVHTLGDVVTDQREYNAICKMVQTIHVKEEDKKALSAKDKAQHIRVAADDIYDIMHDDEEEVRVGENGAVAVRRLPERTDQRYWDTHFDSPDETKAMKDFESKVAKDPVFASKLPPGKTFTQYEENGVMKTAEVTVTAPCPVPPEMNDENVDLRTILRNDNVVELLKRCPPNFKLEDVASGLMEPILAQTPNGEEKLLDNFDGDELYNLLLQTMLRFQVDQFCNAILAKVVFITATKASSAKVKVSLPASKKRSKSTYLPRMM